jgi:hypothetical protein
LQQRSKSIGRDTTKPRWREMNEQEELYLGEGAANVCNWAKADIQHGLDRQAEPLCQRLRSIGDAL